MGSWGGTIDEPQICNLSAFVCYYYLTGRRQLKRWVAWVTAIKKELATNVAFHVTQGPP